MTTLDCSRYSFNLGGQPVQSATVAPIGFAAYVAVTNAATRAGRSPEAFARNVFRARLKAQVTLQLASGQTGKLDDEAITALHPRLGLRLKAAIDSSAASAGRAELLGNPDADGITEPIHVKLGDPIKGAGDAVIDEIEFQAKTLGEMEDVITADDRIGQVLALMKIGRPVTGSLSALPSWAVDQISMGDGLFLLTEVLGRFLDDPAPAESPASPGAEA
ncbi:hypothetical protein [Bosea sp. ANAM02]|uniref:hypothetical protein n=1 Tax=Bosea sp. ANAM02 TaxID=2020412 RepID=UPI00140EAD80|nr:hypothetical protein [Bosea sp. ANAM02]BCB20289.1 hypothetical protein OCUBac02_31830 [Bosea sp. ANAM02]